MTLDWAAQWSKLHQFWYAGAPVCLALAPAKVPTSTQLPGRENLRTAETNKNFPRAPTCLHWLALQPTRRAPSVDAAFADPSKTDSILAVAAVVSQVDNIHKNSACKAWRRRGCVEWAPGDAREALERAGLHDGLLMVDRHDRHDQCSKTHGPGGTPTYVLCQGTNWMRLLNHTSSVRAILARRDASAGHCRKIPKVAHSLQQRLVFVGTLFSDPNPTSRCFPRTLIIFTQHSSTLPALNCKIFTRVLWLYWGIQHDIATIRAQILFI